MKLLYTHHYPAAPQAVAELLSNEAFLQDLAKDSGATAYSVTVGSATSTMTMEMPVPGELTRFVGNTLKLEQSFGVLAARPDGTIPGKVTVIVPGMPVDVAATFELAPEADGTIARYEGDLKVKIPLVGKKVEAQIEPFITHAFEGLERRATAWLSA